MSAQLHPLNPTQLEPLFLHKEIDRYFSAALTTFLLYHHVLTFEQERLWIWEQPATLSGALFLVFRYTPPVAFLMDQGSQYTKIFEPWSCGLWWPRLVSGPIITVTTGIILILRAQAIYGRAKWVLCCTVPFYLGQIAILTWSLWKDVARPVDELGHGFDALCITQVEVLTGSSALIPFFISAIIFDVIIFGLTFFKGLQARRSSPVHLMEVIFRDGNMYFITILFVNIGFLVLIVKNPFSPYAGTINIQFSSVITVVLVSRLLLNLKEAACHWRYSLNSSAEVFSELSFISFPNSQLSPDYVDGTFLPQHQGNLNRSLSPRLLFRDLMRMDYDNLSADLRSIM